MFVLLTPFLRHAKHFGSCVLIAILINGCASIQQEPRSTLSIGAFHKESVGHSFDESAHASNGISFNLEHEDGEGIAYMMYFSAHHSRTVPRDPGVTDVRMDVPVREDIRPGEEPVLVAAASSRYWLQSIGIGFGYSGKYIGGGAGFHLVNGPRGGIEDGGAFDETPFPMPWLELRAGDLESGWVALRIGSKLGLNDGLLAFLGGEFSGQHFRGALGFGVIGNHFFRTGRTDIDIEGGGTAGCGALSWTSETGWGGGIRATVGESYSVEATITMELGRLHDEESL